jgi:hypothetical protein
VVSSYYHVVSSGYPCGILKRFLILFFSTALNKNDPTNSVHGNLRVWCQCQISSYKFVFIHHLR